MKEGQLPPLSAQTRSLLASERIPEPADPALRERLLARARAAIEEPMSGIGLRAAPLASRRSRAPRTALLIAAALAAAGLAAAGASLYNDQPTRASNLEQTMPPAASPAKLPRAPASALPASPPATVAPEPLVARRAPVAPEPARVSSASTFALELALLEPARRSIARSDFSAALAAIARHQHEYPRGQLAEEREALRVRALWGMGDRDAAERAADLFRKRYPHSGLLSWLKRGEPQQK